MITMAVTWNMRTILLYTYSKCLWIGNIVWHFCHITLLFVNLFSSPFVFSLPCFCIIFLLVPSASLSSACARVCAQAHLHTPAWVSIEMLFELFYGNSTSLYKSTTSLCIFFFFATAQVGRQNKIRLSSDSCVVSPCLRIIFSLSLSARTCACPRAHVCVLASSLVVVRRPHIASIVLLLLHPSVHLYVCMCVCVRSF